MKNQLSDDQSKVYHAQQEALTQRLSKLGFFVGLDTGFIDYETNGGLSLLSDGTFASLIPGVKAYYFMPDPGDDDGTFSALLDILYPLVDENIGIYFCDNSGFKWLVFDTDRYSKLCKRTEFQPDEFRVYPQQNIEVQGPGGGE